MILLCNFQPERNRQIFHHEKAGHHEDPLKKLQRDVKEAMKDNPDPYEVVREKPGYTHITGATLFLGHEEVKGLRTNLNELGAGRVFMSGKKEIAKEGQTTVGFMEQVRKGVGYLGRIYSNSIIQLGKYDILNTSDSAEVIYSRMQKIWGALMKMNKNMKIHAATIQSIPGETADQRTRREELNKMILGTDEPLFNVIDMDKAMGTVDTEKEHLYIHDKTGEVIKSHEPPEGKHWKRRRETPKNEKDIRTVVYLESLIASGRYGPQAYEQFAHTPRKIAYAVVGDSFSKGMEENVGGPKKQAGQYASSLAGKELKPENLPKSPGGTSAQMADDLERKVIPALAEVKGYRSAVIQASAEDVLAPIKDAYHQAEIEEAIKKNLKRMYKSCLESNPPVTVVAMTLPPLRGQIERLYPGEENAEARELHLELAENINKFVMKEVYRLSQHPKNRYKRVMCVRVHEWFGTRKGYVKEAYRDPKGGFNKKGQILIGREIYKMMNMMQDGAEFGKKLFTKPKRGPHGEHMTDDKGNYLFEQPIYDAHDYFMDEHDYEPSGGWKTVAQKK